MLNELFNALCRYVANGDDETLLSRNIKRMPSSKAKPCNRELKRALAERALNAEIDHHLENALMADGNYRRAARTANPVGRF